MNPPFVEDIVPGNKVARGWVTWFQSVAGGGAITNPTLPASPGIYKNTTNVRQQVIYAGGAVSAVAFTRDGSTFYTLPNAGTVVLAGGDSIRVTYTVAPTTFAVVPI